MFQIVTHFHAGHLPPKTLVNSFGALLCSVVRWLPNELSNLNELVNSELKVSTKVKLLICCVNGLINRYKHTVFAKDPTNLSIQTHTAQLHLTLRRCDLVL